VLVYSAHVDAGLVVAAVVAGADGVVSKGTEVEELCRAIRLVAAGRTLPPHVRPGTFRSVAERLEPADVPILGMLVHSCW